MEHMRKMGVTKNLNIECYKCHKKIGVINPEFKIPISPQDMDNEGRGLINKIQHNSDVAYIFCPECYKEI